MGNWRTVNIIGTFDPAEVEAARRHLTVDEDAYENVGPLSISSGLAALGDWPAPSVAATGNLYERDYSVQDVANHLWTLLAVAPKTQLKIHCGNDWESTQCVATITVADGTVRVADPEVSSVKEPSMILAMERLANAIVMGGKRPNDDLL
jgi:hypothetical protein